MLTTLLEQAESLGLTRQWGRLVAAAVLERVRLSCLEGRISESVAYLDRLDRLAKEHPASKSCAWSDIHRYSALAHARVALLQDDSQNAISILKNLRREVDNAHSYYFGLRVDADLAMAHFRAGERADALATLRKVLDKGYTGGRLSDDPRSGTGDWYPTVKRSGKRGAQRRFCRISCLTSIALWAPSTRISRLKPSRVRRHRSQSRSAFAKARSSTLIAQGRSNKEIARTLSIAPETVKTHMKHIFTKLNVERRAQAVSRAQSLGLVTTL